MGLMFDWFDWLIPKFITVGGTGQKYHSLRDLGFVGDFT